MFSHNVTAGMFSSSKDALLKNQNDASADLFSNLGNLHTMQLPDGIFHLKVCFPDLIDEFKNPCNEWIQTSNPVTETTITGYKPIRLTFPKRGDGGPFMGLGLNQADLRSHTLIDDMPDSGFWWLAIGAISEFGTGTIPGPCCQTVSQVELFIEEVPSCKTPKGKSSITFSYILEELTFPAFHVWYRYQAASQQLLDSWQDKRMTGFKLNWYIQDVDGIRVTKTAANGTNTKSTNEDYYDDGLNQMVELARQARVKGLTAENFIDMVTKVKMDKTRFLELSAKCDGNQLTLDDRTEVLNDTYTFLDDNSLGSLLDVDIKTGFMLYSAVIYCDYTPRGKLAKFLHNLIARESPRTIIKTLVNSIEIGQLMELVDPSMVSAFYSALDSILQLQYGKVLLATAPRNHLERVLERGWPYFTNMSHHVSMCLNGTNCQEALDLVNSLGEVLCSIPCSVQVLRQG